jgi:hypothetical protein
VTDPQPRYPQDEPEAERPTAPGAPEATTVPPSFPERVFATGERAAAVTPDRRLLTHADAMLAR